MEIVDPTQLQEMQAAFAARDRSQDGRFVVAVKSTGIYCRPSCPARRPRPENIAFFESNVAARQAGFRSCKRCKPDEVARDRQAVELAAKLIAEAEERLSLDELARACGYSPSHLQRVFKRETGYSPAEYGRRIRAERAENALEQGLSVTEAVQHSGFSSPARFYDAMAGRLGMQPSAWANDGKGVTIRWGIAETSLGPILLAATAKGVCRLSFGEGREALEERFPKAELVEGGGNFARLLAAVVSAVENPGNQPDIPLDVAGTQFQQAIWQALRQVPPGETRSYAQLAAAIGKPRAVRAAGSANGANHVAVLIPCHRVVRADGSIGGYAYGSDIKRALLEREAKV